MQPTTQPKALTIVYWVTTSLVVLNFTFGGVSSLLGSASSAEVFSRLGYPGYFGSLLGTAQVLAAAALLLAVPRVVREWAYAGLVFDTLAACVSLLAIGSPVLHLTAPVIALGVVLVSYRSWHRRTKLATVAHS